MLVRYDGNSTPAERTSRIRVEAGDLLLGGEIEVSPEEYQRLAGRYQLKVLDEDEASKDESPADEVEQSDKPEAAKPDPKTVSLTPSPTTPSAPATAQPSPSSGS
jgi:heme-binding NEAT domain protein